MANKAICRLQTEINSEDCTLKLRFPIHVHISTLFLILLLGVGGIIGSLGYRISGDILKSMAGELSGRIERAAMRELTNLISPAEMATRLLSLDAITQAKSLEQRLESLDFLREALNNSPGLTSLYIGYDNGDFFLIRRLWNDDETQQLNAPKQTTFIVQSIDRFHGTLRGRFIFIDASLAILRSDDRLDYAGSYDPRTREWYKAGRASTGQIKTAPYLFFTTRKVGMTIAQRAKHPDAVVGADIRLETLDETLAKQKVTPGTHVVLVNRAGSILAYENYAKLISHSVEANGRAVLLKLTELRGHVFAQLAPLVEKMDENLVQKLLVEVEAELWHATLSPVKMAGANPLFLITAIPDKELMAPAYNLMRQSFIVMVLVILLAIPITWLLARAISRPLRKLAGEAEAIRHFEFSTPISVESFVLEVSELALTMDSMKHTISRFLKISLAVSAENNFDRLLPFLLAETISAADADAGVLYLIDDDKFLPATGLMADGSTLSPSAPTHDPANRSPLLKAAMQARTAHSAPLTDADSKALDLAEAIQSCGASHGIAVPLLNSQQTLVGTIVLLRQAATDDARLSFIEALSGPATVSLENKELIHAQKLLFEAFIKLIAAAIDAKSSHTGGHCARVPELAKMLAQAACAQTSGPYRDFSLSEDDWEAVHIAAWLHDCGKITTPEYVVNKATRLETLYDRIHEIRMRFEILKRDAEIACLKAIAAGEPEPPARAKLSAEQAQLDDDFTFVATCNAGEEFMAPEKLARLQSIAGQTWLRTLDDRIGISLEEKERKARSQAPELPVIEPLLADKPEHFVERLARDRIAENNRWGIKMVVPDLLYNKGELHNLSIARGTLSEEERYKINEHIVQTLIMLSQLPFPKHLRQVPEIASGHHEKMDGTGYPKGLRGEDMSPLARMLAIADIFEALTAVDRPYKKGKTLSETIQIMSSMKKDQHIDADLFDLFLLSGVYRDYAELFLKPEQIDKVDVAAYVDRVAES